MDFTREPIIESVITPREGCKLVVRSSKSTGQEEYFVDALEIVSFGHSFFFRSLERPKAFLVPVSDYEILEVREARMVLKNVGVDRAIKIGGGRDAQMRGLREQPQEKQQEAIVPAEEYIPAEPIGQQAAPLTVETKPAEVRLEKKRDRRRHYRRRRGREDGVIEEGREVDPSQKVELPEPHLLSESADSPLIQPITTTSILTSLLPPPPTLISETIARYKDNALFRGAFYSKEESKPSEAVSEEGGKPVIPIEQPAYGTFEVTEEEEEQIYQERKLQHAYVNDSPLHVEDETVQDNEQYQNEAVDEQPLNENTPTQHVHDEDATNGH